MNELIISTTRLPIVCGCGHLIADEEFYHADRILDFNVLIYVYEGVIYVSENGTDYEVRSGELLFLKNGIRHYGKKAIPKGTQWYYAHFYLSESDDPCNSFEPSAAALEVHEPLTFSSKLPKKLSGLRGGQIEEKISQLAEFCRSDDPHKRMRINTMLQTLLTDIALNGFESKKSDSLSEKICRWLDEHTNEPFSSARLEQEFYLSYKRMAAVFKQERSETMQQYHTRRRMSKASHLLRSTLLSITEIAEQLGYDDPLYFSRCFHSFSGQSPSDHRASAKGDY